MEGRDVVNTEEPLPGGYPTPSNGVRERLVVKRSIPEVVPVAVLKRAKNERRQGGSWRYSMLNVFLQKTKSKKSVTGALYGTSNSKTAQMSERVSHIMSGKPGFPTCER